MAKSAFSVNLEYFLLRFICALVNVIPYALAMALARGFGWIGFHVVRFKRARTLERIRSVFPEKSPRECRVIAVRSLQNVLQTGVEMMRAPKLDRAWMDRYVKDGSHYKGLLQEFVDEGTGVVIMVPHSGNWYMAAWAMAQYGIPLSAIAAKQRNPYVNAWMKRQYGSIDVVERGSASVMRDILGILRQGRGFAILPDLRVPARDVEVPFLNGTANVSHGGAMFAVATGAPIVVAIMRRVDGRHVFDHLATLCPDPNAKDRRAEACRLTAEAMKLLDAGIRRTPEQWFWYNKRWILQPVQR